MSHPSPCIYVPPDWPNALGGDLSRSYLIGCLILLNKGLDDQVIADSGGLSIAEITTIKSSTGS